MTTASLASFPLAPFRGDDDLASYLADNYGHCRLERCRCVRPEHPWLGRGCVHWAPSTAKTWAELKAQQESTRT